MSIILTEFDIQRFWSKVNIGSPEECWEWKAGKSGGYGMFYLRRPTGIQIGTHRLSFLIAYGEIPNGLHVCHHCDNKRCVNPKHLFIGTIDDNNKDKTRKGRQAKGETSGAARHPEKILRGENHGEAKLTDEAVSEIRSSYVWRTNSSTILMEKFGISRPTVLRIVKRQAWTHVA